MVVGITAVLGYCHEPVEARELECSSAIVPSPYTTGDTEPDQVERRIIDHAVTCENGPEPDPWDLWRYLEHEERAGIPAVARGLVLSAACQESGYTPDGRRGDQGTARGLLQMWPWWVSRYGVDRGDPDHAAETWLHHTLRQLPGTRRACEDERVRAGETQAEALWRRANARAVRSSKKARCNESVGHWRRLMRWTEAAPW